MSTNSLATADSGHYLFDLLFSPKAAFVWDGVRQAITWMNKAAQKKFNQSADELTASLSKTTTRRLAALCDWTAKTSIPSQIGIAGKGGLKMVCRLTPQQLANGHAGVILAETEAHGQQRAQTKPKTLPFKPPSPLPTPPAQPPQARQTQATAQPRLSDDELRAFQALGRKVRKLCRQKKEARRAQPASKPAAAPARPSAVKSKSETKDAGFQAVVPAFDAFLKLGRDLRVNACEGRLQKIGWRKADVVAQKATALFPKSERLTLERALRKVTNQGAKIARLASIDMGRDDRLWTARIVFGAWPLPDADYFMTVILVAKCKKPTTKETTPSRSTDLKKLAA